MPYKALTAFIISLILHVSGKSPELLSGRHLQIATKEVLPYVFIQRDTNGNVLKVHGPVAEITHWLSLRNNFTYHYLQPSDGSFGSIVNGSWNGMIKMALDRKVDLIAAPLTPTNARSQVVDFTISFFEEPLGIAIPAPEEGGKSAAIIKPFTATVWTLTLLSMIAVALATWKLTNVTWRLFQGKDSIGSDKIELSFTPHLLFAFGNLSLQARMCTATNSITRTVATVWCLTSVVLVNVYTGCLISYITIPKLYPLVNSIEDLAVSSQLQPVIFRSSFFETTLLEAESGYYKKLGQSLLKHPENRIGYNTQPLDKIAAGGHALIVEKSFLEATIEQDLRTSGTCRVSLVKGEFYTTSEAFALPKESPLTHEFSNNIIWLRDTGLIQHWIKKHWPKENRCTSSKKERIRPETIKLNNLTGSFILLGLGIAVAILAFGAEFFFAYFNRTKRT